MKKISIFALLIVLMLALAACGKKDEMPNITVPTTGNSVLPEMDPTMDTNIPDDSVTGNSTDTTNTTEGIVDPSDSVDTTVPNDTRK